MPISPMTINVKKAISMFDILIYLHFIQQISKDKEYKSSYNSKPEGIEWELAREHITYDRHTHYQGASFLSQISSLLLRITLMTSSLLMSARTDFFRDASRRRLYHNFGSFSFGVGKIEHKNLPRRTRSSWSNLRKFISLWLTI